MEERRETHISTSFCMRQKKLNEGKRYMLRSHVVPCGVLSTAFPHNEPRTPLGNIDRVHPVRAERTLETEARTT